MSTNLVKDKDELRLFMAVILCSCTMGNYLQRLHGNKRHNYFKGVHLRAREDIRAQIQRAHYRWNAAKNNL